MPATVKGAAAPRSIRDALPPPPGAAAAHPAVPVPNGVLRLSSTSDEPEQREPLFYIDDTEYTIPADPPASLGLAATHLLAQTRASLVANGVAEKDALMAASGVVQDFILGEMLGKEGHEALLACKTISRPQIRQLMQICSDRAMGAMEDPNP